MKLDPWAFEEEGTQQWFCSKTRAPQLHPTHLVYQVKIHEVDGGDYLTVAIVDPTKRNWYGRKGKRLTWAGATIHVDNYDWRETIGELAERAFNQLDHKRSVESARGRGDYPNPYFGTFALKEVDPDAEPNPF